MTTPLIYNTYTPQLIFIYGRRLQLINVSLLVCLASKNNHAFRAKHALGCLLDTDL